ncbi:methylcrotonoyl-CoA carboxylase [Oceanicola sp. 22II-s10i]|uniref:acyl-CoA carboxylase subunit beta n=1 Tax=Oceanicola sp. 22II-s10i TaxID=1317116 RepID=UPI000B51F6D2|nr:carboxyl transferase domain-containing protein [Oceanicola sp. 22II-s10i]OWU83139.1 methylcrotonoyl-CoA carboxylase [Oceanicola sp. 22II-s10i]
MSVITSAVSTASDEFKRNAAEFQTLLDDLRRRRRLARVGGEPAARKRHTDAGKLLPRDRVAALLDPGSPFLELAEFAGDEMYGSNPPGAGIITGIGRVSGRVCMIVANDATVKGGTYYTLTAKKHVRAQQIAWQHRLPGLTLVDSGGANLPEMAGIFPDSGQYGSVLHQLVRQSADGVPQLSVVHGACTAGGAYTPVLTDQTVIVKGQGYIHLGGPEIVQAATGEVVDRESLGGAEMHTYRSGVTDYIANDDRHALGILRQLVTDLPARPDPFSPPETPVPPRYDPREIYGILNSDTRVQTNTREIIARLVDDSRFEEFKRNFGETLLCGFAHWGGHPVGIVANQGVLMSDSSIKAVQFIDLCCKRNIPLIFMADVTGYMVGREAEVGGIAKNGAKMVQAMSAANVPKYNLVIGSSYGAGYMGMCGRPFEPHFSFGWPNGRAALMGPEQAATTLSIVQRRKRERLGQEWSEAEEEAFRQPIRDQFSSFSNMRNFAANLWIDSILDPAETRMVMSLVLDLAARVPPVPTSFPILRM